jgi:oligopeptide transport system substrate-binding protein
VQTWIQSVYRENYTVTGWADYAGHLDPVWFLESLSSQSTANATAWTDRRYDVMMAAARSSTDPATRLRKPAACERHLLRALPVLPLYGDGWIYMRKPFVRAFGANLLDREQFKYTWIDRNWRAP